MPRGKCRRKYKKRLQILYFSYAEFLRSCDFIFLRGLPFSHLVVPCTRIVQEVHEVAQGLLLKCLVTRIATSLINLRQFLCALSQRLFTSLFPDAPFFYHNDCVGTEWITWAACPQRLTFVGSASKPTPTAGWR